MDLGISGKTAAVAAASKGLGLASAKALAAEGVRVVICGRHAETVAQAAADIGHGCIGLVADVSDAAGGTAFIAAATEALGSSPDIVVCNAGGPPAGNFASTALDAYSPALDMSLLSTVAMCQAAIPPMQATGWGRVVAITSVSVRQPIPNLILSNTARAGVTGFLKTVAREVAADGVTVNSVQPGTHLTDRIAGIYGDPSAAAKGIPANRLGDPGDFGTVVAFLCSQQANYVTGAHLQVDGGSYSGLQ